MFCLQQLLQSWAAAPSSLVASSFTLRKDQMTRCSNATMRNETPHSIKFLMLKFQFRLNPRASSSAHDLATPSTPVDQGKGITPFGSGECHCKTS